MEFVLLLDIFVVDMDDLEDAAEISASEDEVLNFNVTYWSKYLCYVM